MADTATVTTLPATDNPPATASPTVAVTAGGGSREAKDLDSPPSHTNPSNHKDTKEKDTKDSLGTAGKSSTAKKLSANAPVFDVSRSPTLDPYTGPNAIHTKPVYVPPATIPPAAQQQSAQQTTSTSKHANITNTNTSNNATNTSTNANNTMTNTNGNMSSASSTSKQANVAGMYGKRSPHQPPYNSPYENGSEHDRDRRNQMYHKYQNMRNNHAQYPPPLPHQKYPPNYGYPPMNMQHPNSHDNQYRHPMMHRNNGYDNQHNSNGHMPHPHHPHHPHPPMHNHNGHLPHPNHPAHPRHHPPRHHHSAAVAMSSKNGMSRSHSDLMHHSTQLPGTAQSTQLPGTNTSSSFKVQFRTFTKQRNATALGSTLAYKTPSRSHFGQPEAKQRDPKFTNPPDLLHIQRWELLESAMRWLPGEGTFITWKNYRYLIGPPIHMGMNGHIHYCYKYPLPKHEREARKRDKARRKKEEDVSSSDDEEEVDENSPCVETLAAKIVPNKPAFAREIVILRALQHCENVTELYEVIESERTLISILELAQADVYNFFVGRGSTRHGWNLDKPAVREHFSKMVISNVVQGLDQMHRAEYLHCDLKSLNILLYIYVTDHSNRRGGVYIKAKLTDFGHSSHGTTRIAEKLFPNGMARVGTAGHVAPELFKEGSKCSSKIDIWSLGIVMFSMLVPGRLLFSEYTNLEALKRGYDRLNKMNPWSRDRPSWWTDFERLSPEARDLILWMTRYDAASRPTCAEILKHPWFLIGKQGHREHYRPKLKYVDMLCSSSIAQE